MAASSYSESEYVALAGFVNENEIFRQVEEFIMLIKRDCAVPIMEGNNKGIKMANLKHSSRRTRHTDVMHHVVRDADLCWEIVSPSIAEKQQDIIPRIHHRHASCR